MPSISYNFDLFLREVIPKQVSGSKSILDIQKELQQSDFGLGGGIFTGLDRDAEMRDTELDRGALSQNVMDDIQKDLDRAFDSILKN